MLVFGTQIHIVTFIFIALEMGMFIFQFFYYLFRPQDKIRLWYLLLLFLMRFYSATCVYARNSTNLGLYLSYFFQTRFLFLLPRF